MRKRSSSQAPGRNEAIFGPAAFAGIVLLGMCGPAHAQEVSANVVLATDYVFRGVSQTEGDPALQAGVDLSSGAFYAGAWASNVAFAGDDGTSLETDLYLGVRPEFAGWSWDIGAVGYLYDDPSGLDYDYVELKAAASRAVGPATFGFAAYWSPDFFGAAEDEATYVEVNAAFSATDRWTVSGAVGRQFVSSDFDYAAWNLGAAYGLTDDLAIDLRYHDTDGHGFGEVYESRIVASLKATF
jgi:uncharacterized protein (TIGR02001 family)